jgi:hypothetical protein
MKKRNEQRLYDLQVKTLTDGGLPATLGFPGTLDAWRQQRMYNLVRPIIEVGRHDRWLTIGDSGADAAALVEAGIPAKQIIASSLSTIQIEGVRAAGFLEGVEVQSINAESIVLPDDAVDFVLGKEIYHHFPRPAIGLYEMLRVAKKAVVLIEPIDFLGRPLDKLRDIVKALLRRKLVQGEFEYYGNYSYRLSIRETMKIMTAMAYADMYVLLFNEYGSNSSNQPISSRYYMGIQKLALGVQNLLATVRLMSWGKAVVVLAKQPISVTGSLEEAGFQRTVLPINPYLIDEDLRENTRST